MGAISSPLLYRYLFLLKLPMVLAEIIAAITFSRLLPQNKRQYLLTLWMFNPLMLYLVPAFTNIDIFPILFILLHFLLYKQNRIYTSSLMLGIAASFKFFPALLFPFLILSKPGLRLRLVSILFFLFPLVTTQIPVISNPLYQKNVLFGGNSGLIFQNSIRLGNITLPVYILCLATLLIWYLRKRKSYSLYFFTGNLTLVLIFILGQFHVQWLLWILPFIFAFQISIPGSAAISTVFYVAYFILIGLMQSSLNIGMLAPIQPTFWLYDWPLKELLKDNLYPLINLTHFIISVILIIMLYKFARHERT